MSMYVTYEVFPTERADRICEIFRAAEKRVLGEHNSPNMIEEMGGLEEDDLVEEGVHKWRKHVVVKFAFKLNREEMLAVTALGVKMSTVAPNSYKPLLKFK